MSSKGNLWSIVLSIALVLTTVACPVQASAAENGIAIDEAHFPDAEFRMYIAENCDDNEDGILSQEEVQNVTSLGYLPDAITSVEGIEYFSNLRTLAFERAGVTELDVSSNPKLRELSFESANITELDLSHNPELERLECGSSNLTRLDLSNNTKLKKLRCGFTNISILDLSHNPELNELECGGTNITMLDLRHNSKLGFLVCSRTNLRSLDISHNPELYYLDVSSTKIADLDTSSNPELLYLVCSNTNLERLNLSKNPKVWNLDCSNTNLTYLDINKDDSSLEVFDCKNTNLTSLDLQKSSKLAILEADGCPLISLLVPTGEYTGGHIGGRCIYCDSLAPYSLTLQPGQDSVDLKTIAPTLQGGKILNLQGCEKQGTVLTGLKVGQRITYDYDYNGGFITVTIEVIEGSGAGTEQPEKPVQQPTISTGEGYSTSLSEDGTTVTIAVKDGYVLEDVKVNGISKGKLSLIPDLKTGDRVEITVSKIEEPTYDFEEAIITISSKSYAYTGKIIKPTPTVMFDGNKLEKDVDYTVSYSKNKKIGTASVIVEGKGVYQGKQIIDFKIVPKKVTISSAKSLEKKSVTVRWKKVPQATGYQVQWRKSSKFSSSLSKKVKGTSITSTKIKKLSSKKKYYVRVRAYKVVNGKTYYGKWSTVRTAKVK